MYLQSKTLHAGDPDFYTQFRPRQEGPLSFGHGGAATGNYTLQLNDGPSRMRSARPHPPWQDAMPIPLARRCSRAGDDTN